VRLAKVFYVKTLIVFDCVGIYGNEFGIEQGSNQINWFCMFLIVLFIMINCSIYYESSYKGG